MFLSDPHNHDAGVLYFCIEHTLTHEHIVIFVEIHINFCLIHRSETEKELN